MTRIDPTAENCGHDYPNGEARPDGLHVEASAWRTIDSAPKDGTDVLLAVPLVGRDGFWHAVGAWAEPETPTTTGERGFIGIGDRYDEAIVIPATHWMPLPAPPKPGDAGGGE